MAPTLQYAGAALIAAPNPIRVLVDDEEVVFDALPFMESGRVLVPIRGIAEALGLSVEWIPDLKCVILTPKPGSIERTIIIYPGMEYALVDSYYISLDVPAKIINGRTYLPLRFIGEATGAEVQWDAATRTVLISSPVPLLKGKSADTPFSILQDRLSIKMPEGSVYQDTNYGGIMGSEADSSGTTNIILSENEQSFVAYAEELFRYSTGDISKDFEMFLELNSESAEIMTVSSPISVSGIQYVTFAPKEIEIWGTTFLKGAIVKAADNTLIYLGVYANAQALAHEDDCLRMADDVIGSIVAGTRLLDRSPRTVEMYDFSLKLERDYVYIVSAGVDFYVSYFYKLVPIGDIQPAFGIYSGAHPSLFGSNLPNHEQRTGTILGRQVSWDIYSNQQGVIDKDTFFETLIGAEWWYWHIFAQPNSRSEWQTIERMLASMKEI